MQSVRSAELVWCTRDVGGVVFAVTRLMMAVCEDGQSALGLRRSEFRLRPCGVECLFACVKRKVEIVLLQAADAFFAGVAATTVVIDCRNIRNVVDAVENKLLTLRAALVFELVLVLLLATVAFGVMGLGLARTATVLALLDRTTLRVNMLEFSICEVDTSVAILDPVSAAGAEKALTAVCASAHTMALDARLTCPFLAVDNRHPLAESRPRAVVATGTTRCERSEALRRRRES
jgi:hypothetical protein